MAHKEITRKTRHSGSRRQASPIAGGGIRQALGELFPSAAPGPRGAPAAEPGSGTRRRAASIAIQVAAVAAGAIVLLLRIPVVPAWDCIYGEDFGLFLVGSLARPWRLFLPYA